MDSTASALDLLAALLTGRAPPTETEGDDHRRLLALLATSLAVLVGCGVALLVRRSTSSASPQPVKASPPLAAKKPREEEPDPDDGRQRVALFFGTQTGTAEGFAKVRSRMLPLLLRVVAEPKAMTLLQALAEEAKARYDKAVFKVVDLVSL
jgi:NADPH-ferrihemoprotein reductase